MNAPKTNKMQHITSIMANKKNCISETQATSYEETWGNRHYYCNDNRYLTRQIFTIAKRKKRPVFFLNARGRNIVDKHFISNCTQRAFHQTFYTICSFCWLLLMELTEVMERCYFDVKWIKLLLGLACSYDGKSITSLLYPLQVDNLKLKSTQTQQCIYNIFLYLFKNRFVISSSTRWCENSKHRFWLNI